MKILIISIWKTHAQIDIRILPVHFVTFAADHHGIKDIEGWWLNDSIYVYVRICTRIQIQFHLEFHVAAGARFSMEGGRNLY